MHITLAIHPSFGGKRHIGIIIPRYFISAKVNWKVRTPLK